MTTGAIQLREAREQTHQEEVRVAAWERRRPDWTRTDTARWLDERSEPVLAWVRRRRPPGPAHSRAMGFWLKDNAPELFTRAHERLKAGAGAARNLMTAEEVLR